MNNLQDISIFCNNQRHPINYIMYQDNQNFISCDNSGVILIWSYHKNFLIKDVYIPFIKISQNMITQQYVPKGSPIKKFQLTDKNDKSKLQIAQQYYSEIQKEFDEKTSLIINEERINDQENYILISRNGPLEGQQQVQLHQLKIDSIQKIIISHEEQIYEIIEQQANIQQIQEFQNKLVLMKKFPHLFKSDKNKIQFIIFDIKKTSFFNLQINIEISKNDTDPQFQVYDNLYPFENPNILLLTQQYLQIFSLSTGQLVKNICVHELLPQNQYFNFIQIDQIHRNIFLARTNYQIYQFQIEEVFPTPQEQQAIKELQKLYEN